MGNKEQLTEQFVGVMERMSERMRLRSPEEWSGLELTMPQARTLFLLSRGPKRMSELASHLGCGLSAGTSMIDRMVKKGLVQRVEDSSDRRVVACRLSEEGEQVVQRVTRVGRMRIEGLAEVLSLEELELVVKAMEIMSEGIGRRDKAASDRAQAGLNETPVTAGTRT
ncbi:MAG: MarR family transcriptional regulator [Chloroflexi bacterium]|nr:MarR family transcriptional regulator [Chloroflexota bacterium]